MLNVFVFVELNTTSFCFCTVILQILVSLEAPGIQNEAALFVSSDYCPE